jgi:hypothetical protein
MAPRRSAWVTSHRGLCPLRPSKRIRKRQRKRMRVRNDSDMRIPIERFDRGNLRPCPFNANARACAGACESVLGGSRNPRVPAYSSIPNGEEPREMLRPRPAANWRTRVRGSSWSRTGPATADALPNAGKAIPGIALRNPSARLVPGPKLLPRLMFYEKSRAARHFP